MGASESRALRKKPRNRATVWPKASRRIVFDEQRQSHARRKDEAQNRPPVQRETPPHPRAGRGSEVLDDATPPGTPMHPSPTVVAPGRPLPWRELHSVGSNRRSASVLESNS